MSQQIIDLEISSPGEAPGAANMKPIESIAFSRGRRSLDHSVWYSGSLMTFSGYRRRHARAVLVDRSGRQERQCAASTHPSSGR